MRKALAAMLLGTALCFPALADFDQAMSAYRIKDYDTAFKEFYEVAIAGDHTAQFNLGVMYYRGQGVDKDLVQAFSWIELSTQRGDEDNVRAHGALTIMLDPEQIRQGQQMAAELAQTHGLHYTPPDYGDLDAQIAVR